MDSYATHLAPLVRAAMTCDGPILELGCGDYSTPVLAEIAKGRGLDFLVMASMNGWSGRFAGKVSVRMVDDWRAVEFGGPWGMVFVDNEEQTADRIRHLPSLLSVTTTVVLHDLEASESHRHWPEMVKGWRVERFSEYNPGTAICYRSRL